MKRRNPRWGCPRIAQQIALALAVDIDKDVVRRVLATHDRPAPHSGGPSWLTFLGHAKDSLWSIDLFRLRRLLEARLGKPGTREYIQVLRLLEDFQLAYVRGAVQDAVRLGAIGFDAVKHLVLCRLDHRPARLDLAQYPHLPAAHVATTAATDYLALLGAE